MRTIALSALAAVCGLLLWAAPCRADVSVGQAAPDLRITEWLNADGPVTIEGLRGKVILLEFWATW